MIWFISLWFKNFLQGWIEENSLLACLQLGLAFNREYPTARDQKRAPDGTPVLMSWVSCDEVDTDFTKCRAVNADAHTCSHDKDVYLRCFRPTWAGKGNNFLKLFIDGKSCLFIHYSRTSSLNTVIIF